MNPAEDIIFFTLANHTDEATQAGLMIDSLRSFGGELAGCPVWVFTTQPASLASANLPTRGVQIQSLQAPEELSHYYFGAMVSACAQAEALAGDRVTSLVWASPCFLLLQPPRLFDLGNDFDAAVRPVHIRNVGLLLGAAPDVFWRGIYAALGIERVRRTVESFVDAQALNAYFNSHAFAVRPTLGLMRRWQGLFTRLVTDSTYQRAACQDEPHKIFLFQALLSTLLATAIPASRLRLLPPNYNYPYNLQARIPPERRAASFDTLTCLTYEDRSIDPDQVDDISIPANLRAWLKERAGEASNWEAELK